MSKNTRPTAFEFSTLISLIQEAETYARSIQAHEAAQALNAAKNAAGTARADQLGDGGAARRYAASVTRDHLRRLSTQNTEGWRSIDGEHRFKPVTFNSECCDVCGRGEHLPIHGWRYQTPTLASRDES